MRSPKTQQERLVQSERTVRVRPDGGLRLVVVADTHSHPHPDSAACITAQRPDAILHAGDIGDLGVLDDLEKLAPVVAIRGNIDSHAPEVPDVLSVDLLSGDQRLMRILLMHIAVYGPKLRADALRLAKSSGADLVVCGHSHVPFAGRDKGLVVFNPGSIGPRRFGLPIVFGVMDLGKDGLKVWHVDCETGQMWMPPALPR
jgi:putative phosphoesterase